MSTLNQQMSIPTEKRAHTMVATVCSTCKQNLVSICDHACYLIMHHSKSKDHCSNDHIEQQVEPASGLADEPPDLVGARVMDNQL